VNDDEDFAAFYMANQGYVFQYLYRSLRNWHLAEDLTAEAFSKALGNWDRYTDQGVSRRPWVKAIARNLLYDHLKAAARREVSTEDMLDAEQGGDDLTWQGVQFTLARREVDRALGSLIPTQRRCLELRFLGERSLTETAAALNVTEGAVKQLQVRALKSAHRHLTGAQ